MTLSIGLAQGPAADTGLGQRGHSLSRDAGQLSNAVPPSGQGAWVAVSCPRQFDKAS